MSISTVVTRGFGSFGSVSKLPTLGYSIGAAVSLVNGPVRAFSAVVYHPGAKAVATYHPGAAQAAVYQPGAKAGTAT